MSTLRLLVVIGLMLCVFVVGFYLDHVRFVRCTP